MLWCGLFLVVLTVGAEEERKSFRDVLDKIKNTTSEISDKIENHKIEQQADWGPGKNYSTELINGLIDSLTGKIQNIADMPESIEQKIQEIRNNTNLQNCFKTGDKDACKQIASEIGDSVTNRTKNGLDYLQRQGNECFLDKHPDACIKLLSEFGHFGFNAIKCGFGSYAGCWTVIEYLVNHQGKTTIKAVRE